MASNINGMSAYQQTWQTGRSSSNTVHAEIQAIRTDEGGGTKNVNASEGSNITFTSTWSPATASSLVPTSTKYGSTIGNVQLSDKAQAYYDKLKSKFHNADFILVSKDMKSQVQANAAAYGNANKQVVLIDEEKIERMATDESYRKKYEGIIAMSQQQLASAKNSLASSGASVKNFGMSVDENGKSSFFATLDTSDAQAKRMEKKAEAKKQEKAAQKRTAAKKQQEARLEKARDEKRAGKKEAAERLEAKREEKRAESGGKTERTGRGRELSKPQTQRPHDEETLMVQADSLGALVSRVSDLAYSNSARNVRTAAERNVGQSIDFKG